MGAMHAIEFAGAVEDGSLSLRQALSIHLSSNHFPPVHAAFVPVAVEAIEAAREGDWDREQTYPNGLVRTVAHTIEGLHLDAFLDPDFE